MTGGTKMAELNYMQRARVNGYRSFMRRRDSLIDTARVERQQHENARRDSIQAHRSRIAAEHGENSAETATSSLLVAELNDEGVELIWQADASNTMKYAVVLGVAGAMQDFMGDLMKTIGSGRIQINHIETRALKKAEVGDAVFEVLLACASSKTDFLLTSAVVRQHPQLRSIRLYPEEQQVEVAWFPQCVWELDRCCHIVIKYDPAVDGRHPGFGDPEYRERRRRLAELAAEYKHGEAIPQITYSDAELHTWHEVYVKLKSLYPQAACKEFLVGFKLLEDEGYFSPDFIPQLQDISKFLKSRTGFQLRPCGGLLSARDFLSSLAFRVFQATQYCRHPSSPHHSPEPDVIHEMLGHCPMFTDPQFAQFSQEIGLLSLGASDQEIEKLATVYWFVIEFGLCRENGQLRACGAGLLSAFGELQHALSDTPQHADFEPEKTALLTYEDSDYQPLYVVAESIHDAMQKLRRYAKSIRRPFQAVYDPYSQCVRKVTTADGLLESVDRIRNDLCSVAAVMNNLIHNTTPAAGI